MSWSPSPPSDFVSGLIKHNQPIMNFDIWKIFDHHPAASRQRGLKRAHWHNAAISFAWSTIGVALQDRLRYPSTTCVSFVELRELHELRDLGLVAVRGCMYELRCAAWVPLIVLLELCELHLVPSDTIEAVLSDWASCDTVELGKEFTPADWNHL